MSEMKPSAAERAEAIVRVQVPRFVQHNPPIQFDVTNRDYLREEIKRAIALAYADGRASREPEIAAAREEQMEADVALFEGERAAAEFHRVYQEEAHRRGDVRHPDDYEALSEATKEWDRVLARYCVEAIRSAHRERKGGQDGV